MTTPSNSTKLRVPLPPDSDETLRRELLLRDLDYWSQSFWKNEESGERRVQFLITLVTAVIAGLAALYGYTLESSTERNAALVVLRVGLPALGGLLLVGIVTFLRMVHRDEVSDEYKDNADRLRALVHGDVRARWLLKAHRLGKLTETVRPPGVEDPRDRKLSRSWLHGGLTVTVVCLNALLLGWTVGLLVWNGGRNAPGWSTAAGFAAGLVLVALHVGFMRWSLNQAKERARRDDEWRDANRPRAAAAGFRAVAP